MDNAKEWGERSSKFRLWVAAYVLSSDTRTSVAEALPQVIRTLGLDSKSARVRGAYGLQRYYEDIVRRAKGLSTKYPDGLDPKDPLVVDHLCPIDRKDAAGDIEPESEFPPPVAEIQVKASPPPTPTVVQPPAPAPVTAPPSIVDLDDEFLFDDIGLPGMEDDVTAQADSDLGSKQWAALEAYRQDMVKLAKIPTIPSPRPDLGVTFFPTGRLDVDGVDWNYNGQVAGEMIRDCGEQHLVFSRGVPMKATIDFHGWSFGKDQASGTIWIWAVKHVNGKAMRSWLNDGEDQLRFYYTMDAKGVSQTRKKPQAKGSKKFVVVDQRHIGPLPLKASK